MIQEQQQQQQLLVHHTSDKYMLKDCRWAAGATNK
jgi:hypothetical protein